MTPAQSDSDGELATPAHARQPSARWTAYQTTILTVCVVAYVLLAISTITLLYRTPGERYLFGHGSPSEERWDWLGCYVALATIPIFAATLFSGRRVLVGCGAGLLLLAVLWTVRLLSLLAQL